MPYLPTGSFRRIWASLSASVLSLSDVCRHYADRSLGKFGVPVEGITEALAEEVCLAVLLVWIGDIRYVEHAFVVEDCQCVEVLWHAKDSPVAGESIEERGHDVFRLKRH